MSLVEVLVGVFVMSVVFVGIFGAFKLSIELVYSTKAKIGAVALMSERIEYVRSLPYATLGTVGGIPAGPLPQVEQVQFNGVDYSLRTLVLYVDAPQDGLDDQDENGITADYKEVKVEVAWNIRDTVRTTSITTYATPVGLETLESGGTLRVKVFDAAIVPVAGATVRVVNSTTVPAIDLTVLTNVNGTASFPGAPEAAQYEISVSKDDYSNAQTYGVTLENPSPSPGHVAVVDQTTSTMTLFIDRVGELNFFTYEPPTSGVFADEFADDTLLTVLETVAVTDGALGLLAESPGVYAVSGTAKSDIITADYLNAWDELTIGSMTTVAGGSLAVSLLYYNGTEYVPVPDSVVAGNSTGLASGTYDLSGLAPNTYPSLQLAAVFSGDGTATPTLDAWSVSYTVGAVPLPGVALSLRGNKTIGLDGSGYPLYKFSEIRTTTGAAEWRETNLEWDLYELALPDGTYDIVEMCPNMLAVEPGSATDVSLYLRDGTSHSLRVVVEAGGAAVPDASVNLVGATEITSTTSPCGQTYFADLAGGAYSLEVSKAGYQSASEGVTVGGETTVVMNLIPQ